MTILRLCVLRRRVECTPESNHQKPMTRPVRRIVSYALRRRTLKIPALALLVLAVATNAHLRSAESQTDPSRDLKPSVERRLDSHSRANGNCQECQEDEALVTSDINIPHSSVVRIPNPPCFVSTEFRRFEPEMPQGLLQQLWLSYMRKDGPYAMGVVVRASGESLIGNSELPPPGSSFYFIRGDGNIASCGRAAVVVPHTARITRIAKSLDCPAGGWCGFQGEPVEQDIDSTTRAISVVAKNWSHDRDARVILKVFYSRPQRER